MILETIVTGALQENCYLAGCAQELFVIDPGADAQRIEGRIAQLGAQVKYIVLTHCHWDHIGAAAQLKKDTGAQLVLCRREAAAYADAEANLMNSFGAEGELPAPDLTVCEGDVLYSGEYGFRVMETPGHTEGSMCLLCGDELFSGDTLFRGGMGRTDLPTGSMQKIIDSIINKLFLLDNTVRVHPGHGDRTDIGYEKTKNEVFLWQSMQNF